MENFFARQTNLELVWVSYSIVIILYALVIAFIRYFKSNKFIRRHKTLFHGITLGIAGAFFTIACLVREMAEQMLLYHQLIMLALAVLFNYLYISGVRLSKFKDFEFGEEDADAIREQQDYITSSDKTSTFLRDFIVTISQLEKNHRDSIRSMDFYHFNTEYCSYISKYLEDRHISVIDFLDLDEVDQEKLESFVCGIVKNQGLCYNIHEMEVYISQIRRHVTADLTMGDRVIPVKNKKFFTLIYLSSKDMADFDENFIISSYIAFYDLL